MGKGMIFKVVEFEYMWKSEVVAHVVIDTKSQTVTKTVKRNRQFDDPLPMDDPKVDDVLDFFEERCFPRTRANAKQILGWLGLTDYIPYEIVKKTRGQQWDDFYWIRFKGDTIDYEEIKQRD